ncbi:MAG: hypothetical protein IPK18_08265 [Sphingobacteriales bacterium]|jgi:hypothetical protein|nr:MAG: hypothetical protein IPK18_08265 [Sphingobacteriales bacterium]
MKKLFILFAAATLFVGVQACKSTPEATEEVATEEVVTEEIPAETTQASAGVPTFSNADVQAYVNSYEEYINLYKEAVDKKDMTKMQELATKGQELATKGQEAMSKLTGDDVKKFTDYTTAKANEIKDLAMKLAGQ